MLTLSNWVARRVTRSLRLPTRSLNATRRPMRSNQSLMPPPRGAVASKRASTTSTAAVAASILASMPAIRLSTWARAWASAPEGSPRARARR